MQRRFLGDPPHSPKSAHFRVFRQREEQKIDQEVVALTEDDSVKEVAEEVGLLHFCCF